METRGRGGGSRSRSRSKRDSAPPKNSNSNSNWDKKGQQVDVLKNGIVAKHMPLPPRTKATFYTKLDMLNEQSVVTTNCQLLEETANALCDEQKMGSERVPLEKLEHLAIGKVDSVSRFLKNFPQAYNVDMTGEPTVELRGGNRNIVDRIIQELAE